MNSRRDDGGIRPGKDGGTVRPDERSGRAVRPYYEADGVTIYNADCADVLPSIDPATVALVLTDPPYGIGVQTDYSKLASGKSFGYVYESVAGDDEPFNPAPLLTFPRVLLWGANHYAQRLPEGGSWLVWDKVTRNDITCRTADGEIAWTNAGGKNCVIWRHMWSGAFRDSERGLSVHPTQKPVALMRWVLDRWTKPGDLILDPYMGSGPVARACADLGLRYVGVEIVEDYCRIAVDRLRQQAFDLDGAA